MESWKRAYSLKPFTFTCKSFCIGGSPGHAGVRAFVKDVDVFDYGLSPEEVLRTMVPSLKASHEGKTDDERKEEDEADEVARRQIASVLPARILRAKTGRSCRICKKMLFATYDDDHNDDDDDGNFHGENFENHFHGENKKVAAGTRVMGRVGSRWYPGRVYAVNDGLTSVDVTFDDNDFRPNMPLDRVKLESGGHSLGRLQGLVSRAAGSGSRQRLYGQNGEVQPCARSDMHGRGDVRAALPDCAHPEWLPRGAAERPSAAPPRIRPLQRSVQGCPHVVGRDAAISCESFWGKSRFVTGTCLDAVRTSLVDGIMSASETFFHLARKCFNPEGRNVTLAAWILDALLESGWKVEVGAAHTLAQAIYDPATTEKEVLLLLPVLSKMLRKDVALSKKEVESMLQPMAKAYAIRIEAEQKMGRKVYSLFCRDCSRLSSMPS